MINKYNNLIVVRTMSKAWGMAGLRVGYAVSCKDNINELFQVKPMHQLTSFSVMAAETLLDNTAAVRSYIEEMNRVRQYVTIHFVTAELGKAMDVDSFRKFLKERKYLIRRPFGMPELSRWVRIGLLPMKQMKGFIELLDRFLEENRI